MSEVNTPNLPAPELSENTPWMPGATLEYCLACKRVFLVPASKGQQSCPLCYQAQLVPQPSYARQEAPEILIPAQLKTVDLQQTLASFIEWVPFKLPDLTVENLLNRAQMIWWPLWLVDADLQGEWAGTMGFDYQVRTPKESFGNGDWQSKTALRTQTRYEPRKGTLNRHYDNIRVPALRAHHKRLEQIGNYQQESALPYRTGVLGDNSVQMPEIEPQELLEVAQTRLHAAAEQEIMQANAAQHRQKVKFSGDYLNLNWTQLLMPIVSTWYKDENGKTYPIVLNGQSGKVHGKRMASVKQASRWTLGLMVIPVLLLLAALVISLVAPASIPQNLVCGGVVIFFIALLALIPILRAHHWNNRENNIEDFR
jgi:hypothetical protein